MTGSTTSGRIPKGISWTWRRIVDLGVVGILFTQCSSWTSERSQYRSLVETAHTEALLNLRDIDDNVAHLAKRTSGVTGRLDLTLNRELRIHKLTPSPLRIFLSRYEHRAGELNDLIASVGGDKNPPAKLEYVADALRVNREVFQRAVSLLGSEVARVGGDPAILDSIETPESSILLPAPGRISQASAARSYALRDAWRALRPWLLHVVPLGVLCLFTIAAIWQYWPAHRISAGVIAILLFLLVSGTVAFYQLSMEVAALRIASVSRSSLPPRIVRVLALDGGTVSVLLRSGDTWGSAGLGFRLLIGCFAFRPELDPIDWPIALSEPEEIEIEDTWVRVKMNPEMAQRVERAGGECNPAILPPFVALPNVRTLEDFKRLGIYVGKEAEIPAMSRAD